MDTFYEQLVKMNLTGKTLGIIIAIFAVDAIIIVLAMMFLLALAPAIAFLVLVGVVYGSYKLITYTSVEYEYIFTNGDLDIDKIVGKAKRSRIVSIKCSTIEKYGDYKQGMVAPGSVKKTYHFCNADDENVKYVIVQNKDEGTVMFTFAPNDRVREVIEKCIPRTAF